MSVFSLRGSPDWRTENSSTEEHPHQGNQYLRQISARGGGGGRGQSSPVEHSSTSLRPAFPGRRRTETTGRKPLPPISPEKCFRREGKSETGHADSAISLTLSRASAPRQYGVKLSLPHPRPLLQTPCEDRETTPFPLSPSFLSPAPLWSPTEPR